MVQWAEEVGLGLVQLVLEPPVQVRLQLAAVLEVVVVVECLPLGAMVRQVRQDAQLLMELVYQKSVGESVRLMEYHPARR